MTYRRLSVVMVATALISAAAGQAWAGDKVARPVDFTVKSEPITAAPNAGHAMRWDARKGKFGFTLDMQQPSERPMLPNDIQAGAYFRITPSLRVGGSVALGDQQLTTRAYQARPATAPKVRLESTFKF